MSASRLQHTILILPWVKVKQLASHILGRMALRISADWQRIYRHPIYFLETFVGSERFRGNLLPCGQLGGAGQDDGTW